jgi:dihydropteroate synthase
MNKGTNFFSDKTICCGKKILTLTKPMVMGILNCTPDSFYDGGKYVEEKEIINRAETILNEGGDIIDVGVVSTRPGAEMLPIDVEKQKLQGIIKLLRKEFPEAIISVDTCWAEVAKAVAGEGANIINDISGGQFDENMFQTIAELQLPYVLMHTRGTPSDMQKNTQYSNIVNEIIYYFSEKLNHLYRLGVKDVIIDLGFGFAKTMEQNYELMKNIKEFSFFFKEPLLVGISRKSMIYNLLNTDANAALNGTTVLNTYALMNGAKFIRVHDVKEATECVKILSNINI